MVIDTGVVDDCSYAKYFARVGACREFTAQPPQGCGFQLVVTGFMAFPISADDFRELKPSGKFFKVAKAFTNDGPRRQIPFFSISVSLADKPFHHAGQCPAIGLCPRREVSGHLGIQP
ncbi:hypothetical protein XM52_29285, partial [Roseovarius indicus]